jgi:cyclopropane-fatty-acyl-phospholipid synthase
MKGMLDSILRRFISEGQLTVRWPDGSLQTYRGSPGRVSSGPQATINIRDRRTVRRLILNPGLSLGEAYMDGTLVPEGCTIYDVLDLLILNLESGGAAHYPLLGLRTRIGTALKRWITDNPAARSRRNVAHHYDLNGRLYSLFLDRDRQYSCAYFPTGNETLEEAQLAKKRHIAAKLKLDRPDLTVLDIGCGWGGMALTLAQEFGARVHGVTLSEEQLSEARARAEAAGLADRVTFALQDYRAVTEKYDRIVSVGMFEHVGTKAYRTFFEVVKRILPKNGVALLHSIGRMDGPGCTNSWLAKYIFPGGYSPALSEVLPHIEAAGLWVTDIEILRMQYALTLRQWRRRFAANRDAISALYDERFCRMFDFYLAGSEIAFRREGHMNFQIQMAPDINTVPLTRDYMFETERAAVSAKERV